MKDYKKSAASIKNYCSHEPPLVEQPPEPKEKDGVIEYWKAQVLICLIALAAVVTTRLVGGTVYQTVRNQYQTLFCDKTTVSQVVESSAQTSLVVTPSTVDAMVTVDPTVVTPTGYSAGDSKDDSLAVKEELLLLSTNTETTQSMVVPVKGRVTSPFGYRIHPVYGTRLFHNGVDIGANTGTPIVAVLSGSVEEAGYNDSYGYYVIVNHGKDFKTVYAHCSQLTVDEGERVTQGQTIGLVGSTGVSTGPHLHFEVRRGEYRVNPQWLVDLS